MPNMNSHACHVPIRTCVACRKKSAQKELLAFLLLPAGIVFDINRRLATRKYYVCRDAGCVQNLDKWRKKRAKGRKA
ncbi:MAG: DUF448 domain-containing protein [Candidatus Cloacimonadaceae bacterium]|jgi:predicted RNA-binding protein YlxR (DUF448 family)|nr:DUF448 domain-containing protein [Candidatus Cloacimonadota bacterium]MDY0319578.1 DUF448 domain-containing protein [Candidatus Cloacimonadaceae bacterium]